MPRIRRWHPVSHDFVRDREVQDLRRRFGDWMGYVWLEMLAEADKNEGCVKGAGASLATSLAWVALSQRPEWAARAILQAIPYMLDKGWLEERSGHFFVRKYPEYHRTREQNKSRQGIKEVPSEPSEPSEPKLPPISPNGFDLFWRAYPKKRGKEAALKAWGKLGPDGALLEAILAAVREQDSTEDWQKEGGKFIPHPATWLNGRRWEDQIEVDGGQGEPIPGAAWERQP